MFRYLFEYYSNMIHSLECFQNKRTTVIMSTTFVLVGFISLVLQAVSADQSPETRYKSGYNDGLKHAECDFKGCHGHGYVRTVPTGHTNQYIIGYSKGYHDGWNKATSSGAGANEGSTHNQTSNIRAIPKSQEVPNNVNNNDVCDPTHQFCAMF